jgi:hypothetical protein
MPRPPVPGETYAFDGVLHATDEHRLGDVTGLFFRGHENGPAIRWRSELRWTSGRITPGDSITLRRDGRLPVRFVVMTCQGGVVRFRCSDPGSPV